ncbi:hypothetical protein PV325_001178 [Microctonus aethiopoides]|nr:hypothetical protein PV325_001178 [Microctonus aethiopoides]
MFIYVVGRENENEGEKNLQQAKVDECVVPNGWPLTLGGTGLVLQLGELETSALRHGECYLCVRNSRQSGGDDATTTNTTTTTTTSVIINNESTTENSERQLERIIDIVEIALVWKSSMRVPGILRWEREDDFMDWRELKEHNQTNTTSVTNTSTRRRRRKSRDELSTSAATRIQDTSPSAAIASSSSSSSSNQRLRTDVISPRINTIANDVCTNNSDNEHVIFPITMKFDQRQTNRNHQKDVASRLNIDNLKNPSCLLSIINNQLNNETSSSTLSSSSIIDLPDELNHDELADLISTLLVTVERKIERVNLDDLIFPCPGCRNIDTDNSLLGCTCALPSESDELINNRHNSDICDCGMNNKNSKSFEIDGIKHIDSDDEEEVRMDFGVKRKDDEISSPRSVHEFSDGVINCGLRLPGYADDATGRLVLEFENLSSTIERKNCPREIASYLLYLTRLHSSDRTKNGWTLLICGANNDDFETLDRALVLVQDRVNVRQALALRNTECSLESSMLDTKLPRSRVKIMSIDDVTLNQRIPERKKINYDHQRWIKFYKEYDSLMCEWQSYGRQLVLEMSELKDCTNIANSLTPLTHLLTDASTSIRAIRDVSVSLASLEESAVTLLHIDYVVSALKRAKRLIEEVENAARRLENSFELRRAAIKNFTIARSIEEQAREVLAWLCKKGEDNLAKHTRHATTTTTLTVARLHERDFEKFYFSSMLTQRRRRRPDYICSGDPITC